MVLYSKSVTNFLKKFLIMINEEVSGQDEELE